MRTILFGVVRFLSTMLLWGIVSAASADSNIAPLATVTASSENASGGQTASKAVDGVAAGYPGSPTNEWRTKGQKTGAWLRLVWSSAYTIDRVVLYDRPNLNDQITSATLSFSDGSSVLVGALNNDGSAVTINFSARTVTSLVLTVTGVSGTTLNVGLAEIEVYGNPAGGNQAPVTINACTSTPAGNPIGNGVLMATDPEGQALTFELVTDGSKGFVTVFSSGNFTYSPKTNLPSGDGNARGMDKFVFRATDPSGLSATGTVTVNIDGGVRIMPLGDSITEGVNGNNQPIVGHRVGYRRKLYNDLTGLANGAYGVDFVGQRSEGFSVSPPIGDTDHQGTPGQRDNEVAANVIGYLNATPADIVLLHIGTNDFNTSAIDVQTILNNIDTWESANYPVTVFLARIIDDVPGFGTERDVTTFNNNLTSMVASRPSDRVILVDMQNGAGLIYGSGAPGPDMDDNLHPKNDPNESDGSHVGYAKIANKWFLDMTNPANVGLKYSGLPQCQ